MQTQLAVQESSSRIQILRLSKAVLCSDLVATEKMSLMNKSPSIQDWRIRQLRQSIFKAKLTEEWISMSALVLIFCTNNIFLSINHFTFLHWEKIGVKCLLESLNSLSPQNPQLLLVWLYYYVIFNPSLPAGVFAIILIRKCQQQCLCYPIMHLDLEQKTNPPRKGMRPHLQTCVA